MSNLIKKDKGFTLIEIVLVLAIAGLLLVIVFLAVQGAQRSRRDSQRQNDASRVLAAVESCAANNGGSYATCTGNNVGSYFSPNQLPTGSGLYTFTGASQTSFGFATNALCPGNATTHPVTVSVVLEGGGATYCVGN